MDTTISTKVSSDRCEVVDGLADRSRVRELALFLGLDAESVAEGLVEAVTRELARNGGAYRLHTAT